MTPEQGTEFMEMLEAHKLIHEKLKVLRDTMTFRIDLLGEADDAFCGCLKGLDMVLNNLEHIVRLSKKETDKVTITAAT